MLQAAFVVLKRAYINKKLLGTVINELNYWPRNMSDLSSALDKKPKLRRDKRQEVAKKKSIPNVPSTVNLQVIGAGGNGAPCSLYLFTDQARYLFNCGEGTQRLAHEHKTKLPRLEQIFLTRNAWHVLGGLPGLTLTIQDAGVKELSIHGPPKLDNILQSMRRFVVLKSMQVNTLDCTQEKTFEDNTMTVQSLPLYRDKEQQSEPVIAYICKLKPRAGTLNLEKCVDAGVPPGPLLGLLKNGEDITLEDGRIVRSKDVSEPAEAPLSFIILDVPADDYLTALQDAATVLHQLQANDEHNFALIVHFSPEHILTNNQYQNIIKNVAPNAQHLYVNSLDNYFSGYTSAHRIQYKLNLLNAKVFPLLPESNQSITNTLKKTKLDENNVNESNKQAQDDEALTTHITGLTSLTNFHLRPRKGLDRTLEAKLNVQEYINETQALPGFEEALQKLRNNNKSVNFSKMDYPRIIFLGTGSCIPNKTRNVSAILVQPAENSYMLLDCGEGTLGQIVRYFGKEQAEHVMRNLKLIYVSHIHADHHIGLIGLLKEYERLQTPNKHIQNPVILLAPWQMQPWLKFYAQEVENLSDCFQLIGNSEFLENPLLLNAEESGVSSISTCLVRHCAHAFGVSLTLKEVTAAGTPVKITYSGDTMPCEDLVQLGYKSTILIHEATMEDDLVEEAKLKTHSTISQAIEQGRKMQAEYIILTHFSQRYAKLPRMQTDLHDVTMQNVSIAFDNMRITPADLEHFHLMYPALKALFAEHAEELEQKALKRELKLERKRKILSLN